MLGSTKDTVNYYEVLEVAYDAPQHEVHKAYTRAKATYAQDNPALYSMFTRDEARDLLKLIEEAYAVLGNHGLRRNYDDVLLKRGVLPTGGPSFASSSTAPPLAPAAPEIEHNALPDFVVPDPAIPGSFATEPFPAASTPPVAAPASMAAPAAISNSSATPSPYAPSNETVLVTNTEFTVRKRDSTQTLMPPDTGRCPLGTYKLDEALEQEIAARTEFDGPFLQKVRMYKQVSLEKLSEASRIGKTYLIALESNDFKNLPAPVFLRGFLVQIGKQLGLDDGKVLNSYMNLAKSSDTYSKKYGI